MPASSAPLLQLSGAIFTTDVTGAPVNLNHYAAKQDVYLNGGPGINAPDDAAGLPAGIYAFQVTDPSGKTLLSTDPVSCRRVEVDASGRFVSVAPSGSCAHATGTDAEDGGITVQLFPYLDTPNNRGEYKVWLTPYDALDPTAPGSRTVSSRPTAIPTTSRSRHGRSSRSTPGEIDDVHYAGQAFVPDANGSVTVPVQVKKHMSGDHTYWVNVHCV